MGTERPDPTSPTADGAAFSHPLPQLGSAVSLGGRADGGDPHAATSAGFVLRQRVAPGQPFPRIRGLYLHVPFCFHKCHYCDFYSFVDRADQQPAYLSRLEAEVDAAANAGIGQPERGGVLETIFIGGGTPTLLRPDLLRRALARVAERFAFSPSIEWTVEANPETVTDEVAAILVESGVNRVSLGAQSFHPHHLKTLERWHDPASVPRAVERLRRAGLRRLNLDLIFGVPGSTLAEWESDLAQAMACGPDHLSCYGLTYEPNTAMTKRLELGQFEPCDEDLEAAMYEATLAATERAGFEQYEISNFAQPGQECRHNLLYWRNESWWALGPSASGHVAGIRWKNVPNLTRWLAETEDRMAPIVDCEEVDPDTRAGEILLVGLRLREGVPDAVIEAATRSGRGPARREAIDRAIGRGLLERVQGRVRFTRAGQLLADEVLVELL